MILLVLVLFLFLFLFLRPSTEKFDKHYRVIILVVATDSDFEIKCRDSWKKYKDLRGDVKVFFVYGKNTSQKISKEECDLIFEVDESYGSIGTLEKTLQAIDYINKNYSYDFMLKTNVTCMVDFDNLLKRLKDKTPESFHEGSTCTNLVNYACGSDMILSKDVAAKFTEGRGKFKPEYWDDQNSGYYLSSVGLPVNFVDNVCFAMNFKTPDQTDEMNQNINACKLAGNDVYRVKNTTTDRRSEVDIAYHNEFIKSVYHVQ